MKFIATLLAILVYAVPAFAQQTNYLGTVFIADPTTPTQQLKVNSDGSINANTGGVISSCGTAGGIGYFPTTGTTIGCSSGITASNSALTLGSGTTLTLPDSSTWTSTGLIINGAVGTTIAGSSANPALYVGNATTGLYTVSTTGIGLSVNGTSVLDWGITTASVLTVPNIAHFSSNLTLTTTTSVIGMRNGGTVLSSPAAAIFQLGSASANPAVAQTFQVQSASGTNIAGQNWTINGSLSTGTATDGDIIFQTGVKNGTSGSTAAAATTAMTIKGETQKVVMATDMVLHVYTVTTLPGSPVSGEVALVSDATSNVLIGTGGGAAWCLVAYNGSAWVAV